MKKAIFFMVLIALAIWFGSSFDVIAKDIDCNNCYVNKKGVILTEEEINKLLNTFYMVQIDNFTYEEVQKYLNARLVNSETKYFKTVYQGNNVVSEHEITKEEFESAPVNTAICDESTRSNDGGFFETNYKALSASIFEMSNFYDFSVQLLWKIVPATRSYDVIAFRTKHLSYSNVSGVQAYYVGNNQTSINYNSNSAGYKGLSNGAGISMNLKDDTNITSFLMTLVADMQISEYNYSTAHVFTTYQHAQSSLTRAQSMSYTLQAGGLGDVLYYSNSTIRNKYDDMTGIELRIPIP